MTLPIRFKQDASLKDFLASLPNILAVQSLRELAARMRRARELQKPIIWGIGGHVIKTGLAPIIIDLMKRGFVTAIAANGSVLVHDAEIAMVGSTSEDVDATLGEGAFGGADETGKLLNRAAQRRRARRNRFGRSNGPRVVRAQSRSTRAIRCCALRMKREFPSLRTLTIGGDIGHFHPRRMAQRSAPPRTPIFVCWLNWCGGWMVAEFI